MLDSETLSGEGEIRLLFNIRYWNEATQLGWVGERDFLVLAQVTGG